MYISEKRKTVALLDLVSFEKTALTMLLRVRACMGTAATTADTVAPAVVLAEHIREEADSDGGGGIPLGKEQEAGHYRVDATQVPVYLGEIHPPCMLYAATLPSLPLRDATKIAGN